MRTNADPSSPVARTEPPGAVLLLMGPPSPCGSFCVYGGWVGGPGRERDARLVSGECCGVLRSIAGIAWGGYARLVSGEYGGILHGERLCAAGEREVLRGIAEYCGILHGERVCATGERGVLRGIVEYCGILYGGVIRVAGERGVLRSIVEYRALLYEGVIRVAGERGVWRVIASFCGYYAREETQADGRETVLGFCGVFVEGEGYARLLSDARRVLQVVAGCIYGMEGDARLVSASIAKYCGGTAGYYRTAQGPVLRLGMLLRMRRSDRGG